MKLDRGTGGQGGGTGSKFVSCLSKKNYDLKKKLNKKLKYWHQCTGHRMAERPDTCSASVSLNLPVLIFQF